MATTKHVRVVLKRIDPWTAAKVYAVILAIVGFVIGLLVTLIGAAMSTFSFGLAYGALSIVILPIIFGILGLVAGAICAVLYNLVAGWIGGVELEVDKK